MPGRVRAAGRGVHAATSPDAVVGDVHQAEHHVTQRPLALGADGRQGAFAEAFDRCRQSTDLDVGLGPQGVTGTSLPDLRHRCRDQRQRGVVPGDVGCDHRHQLRFDGAAAAACRLDDDPSQLLVARWSDEHLGVLDEVGERAR